MSSYIVPTKDFHSPDQKQNFKLLELKHRAEWVSPQEKFAQKQY